ncbi:MAG: hypothetical protein KF866_05180 [Phycisphaeraceae bacterium]|nr:hypothetical protein [Phycisphaeraceae bacterium]MCW5754386.1 hypothetical protein [Phycisphaeraceae bacterium]
MMTRIACTIGLAALLSAPVSAGDDGDIAVGNFNGVLMTGLGDDDDGSAVFPERVFAGELIDQGGVIFTDDPGFLGPFGDGFDPGTRIGFNVLKAVREWNGSDFHTISLNSFNISLGMFSINTPMTDSFTAGFDLVADASVDFDEHAFFTLFDDAPGIYLLELELTATGFAPSLPFWIVFNYGLDEEDHEAAIHWVEDNLVPAPGTLALLLFAGAARRRR